MDETVPHFDLTKSDIDVRNDDYRMPLVEGFSRAYGKSKASQLDLNGNVPHTMIYAPWCGHCQALGPKYKKLARHLQGIKSLVIAKMDGTTNEHPRAKAKEFPMLLFYPPENKSSDLEHVEKLAKEIIKGALFIEGVEAKLWQSARESRSWSSWSSSYSIAFSCARPPSKSRQTDCIFRAPSFHALDHSSHHPKASKNHKPTSDDIN